jgi:hypothetical protein
VNLSVGTTPFKANQTLTNVSSVKSVSNHGSEVKSIKPKKYLNKSVQLKKPNKGVSIQMSNLTFVQTKGYVRPTVHYVAASPFLDDQTSAHFSRSIRSSRRGSVKKRAKSGKKSEKSFIIGGLKSRFVKPNSLALDYTTEDEDGQPDDLNKLSEINKDLKMKLES